MLRSFGLANREAKRRPAKAARRREFDVRLIRKSDTGVPNLEMLEARARPYIEEIDAEFNFDFSEFGETLDEIEEELARANQLRPGLARLVEELDQADRQMTAVLERYANLKDDIGELNGEATQALEDLTSAIEQLEARRQSFSAS